MTAPSPIETVTHQLKSLIDAGTHPQRTADRAAKLLDRLSAPVRIAVLGLPSPEKSRLFNALSGDLDASTEPRSIPVELRYGAEEAAEITLADGSILTQPGPFVAADHPQAVFVTLRRPLPALERFCLIDVAADAQPADQLAAIRWAMTRSDIALWTSPAFSDAEMQIWAAAPDEIKDHAYLVLTGRPDGPDPAFLAQHAKRVKALVDYEFLDVVTLGHQIEAETPTLIAPNVETLAARIRQHADMGRRADADGALMFLNSLERVTSRPLVQMRTAPQAPANTPSEPAELTALYATAFSYLRDRGMALLETIRAGDDPDPVTVLTHCGDTLAGLSEILDKYEEDATPGLTALADTLAEAEELVVLLGLEDGAGPGIDAVSLLVQLRREFEARLAA